MTECRAGLILGTAVGAVLAAAFLPLAVASADDTFASVPAGPPSTDTVSGIPPFFSDSQVTQAYDLYDTTGLAATQPVTDGTYVGYYDTTTTTYTAPLFENTQTVDFADYPLPPTINPVTGFPVVLSDAQLAGFPVPQTDTDTLLFGPSGFQFGNFYESIPSTTAGGAPTVTDDLITPFGTFPDPLLGDVTGGLGGLDALNPLTELSSLLSGFSL